VSVQVDLKVVEALAQALHAFSEAERALRAWTTPEGGMGGNIVLEDRGRTVLALRQIAKAREKLERL